MRCLPEQKGLLTLEMQDGGFITLGLEAYAENFIRAIDEAINGEHSK